jgi:SAM-dependent methyltransferase
MFSSPCDSPLNVYAAALELEYGVPCAPHFGLFTQSQAGQSLPNAQQAMLALTVNKIGLQPQRLLLHGTGLQILAEQLAEAGQDVVLLAPSQKLICGKYRVIDNFPQESDVQAHFDLIVQEGSVKYLDQLPLLNRLRNLLKPGGRVLWSNEFVTQCEEPRLEAVSLLKIFAQLAQRLGFTISDCQDLSKQVQPGFSVMLELLDKYSSQLCALTELGAEKILNIRSGLYQLAHKFQTGRVGYYFFELTLSASRSEDLAVVYSSLDSFSGDEFGSVFEKSFGQAFNPRLRDWKYRVGDGRAIVARKHGKVVAHYGGAPRDILYFGSVAKAIQICDVMVLPEERGFFRRDSLFFKTAATFLEREIGYTVEHLLGFGFPNLKTMQLALRLGLYKKTDDFIEVFLPPDLKFDEAPALKLTLFDPAEQLQQNTVDSLWLAMANDLQSGIVGRRDWHYIKYRYFDHPSDAYACYFLRREQRAEAVAFVVLKEHQGSLLLMDIVCSQKDLRHAIIDLYRCCAVRKGFTGLKCWITRGWHQSVFLDGAVVHDLQIEIPCHSWSPGPAAELLYGKWWLTAGDMDFH